MANLYFYNRTALPYYLQMARSLADWLLESADESEAGICWRVNDTIHIGYGYGQSGVALFLLRLSQLSGEEHYRSKGRRALDYDLSNGVEMEQGVLSFPDVPSGATLLPYVEEGSAGIAKVAMRFGNCTLLDSILLDAHRKYAGFAGLLFGLSSFVDAFTDAFLFSQDKKYLTMAKRPISGLRDIYLFKQTQGVAASGDGLFRVTCDYGTGVAGVMRALYRYTHLDHADFVLDEFVSENGPAPAHDDDSFCGEAVAVPLVTGRRLEHNL